MNKSLWSIVAIGAVLLLGGVYVVMASQDSSNDGQIEAFNTSDASQSQSKTTAANTGSESSYTKSSAAELANIANDKRVLFFHASWCSTCKALDKDILLNVSKIPTGVTIAQVDFDEETDLKKKYSVTLQHTLVQIDNNGNEIAKWSGSRDLASLIARIQ